MIGDKFLAPDTPMEKSTQIDEKKGEKKRKSFEW